MEIDPTRMCELLVGLPDVEVQAVMDQPNGPLLIWIQTRLAAPAGCSGCGTRGRVKDRDRVELGDGVISNIMDLEETYRHDPYAITFKRKNFDFILLLVHTRWTNDNYGTRANEVRMLATHINKFRTFLTERDFIVAGDFNYSGTSQVMKDMALNAGLKQIDPNAKSTFKSDNTGYASSYDHIYISLTDTGEFLSGQCRVLDATALVYGDNSTENMARSKVELSDHLPVWALFDVSGPDDD